MQYRDLSILLGLAAAVYPGSAVLLSPPKCNDSLPNWVSPVQATESACYRKAYFSNEACATGYEQDIVTCWAQCPMDYPVECGMECLPQDGDCMSEVLGKVSSVATVALNGATAGVFGQLAKASEAMQLGVKCGQKMIAATSSLVKYVTDLQDNATDSEQLLSLVKQSDLVINELPSAVCTCLGLPVPTDLLEVSAQVVDVVNDVVTEVLEKGATLLDPTTFLSFMSDVSVDDSVQDLDTDSLTQLQDILTAGTTCGSKLQTIIHKVTLLVASIKSKDPSTTISNIRQVLSVSELFVTDIPVVTNNCIRNLTDDAYTTRDSLRTIMSTITDGLINATVDDDGDAVSTPNYLASVADMGLDVIATLDPTGIADMMATFIQPICAPTAFIGEIDDGALGDALALTTNGDAFNGSFGTWNHSGDGTVNVTFESKDSEDVTVVIHSGGDTVDKVGVASGKTVYWSSTVEELQDKTLYMDRWRPGLMGVPGSGGGSLLLWVPRSSAGGHVQLHAILNGDSSESSTGQQDEDEIADGSDEDLTTPAPTRTNVDSSDKIGDSESDDLATPAPTTSADEIVTPAPITSEDQHIPIPSDQNVDTTTKHKLRIRITSKSSSPTVAIHTST